MAGSSTRTKHETDGCSKNTAGLGGVDGNWGIEVTPNRERCCWHALLLPGDRGSVRRRPGQLAE